MQPKKAKELIPVYAERTGILAEDIEYMVLSLFQVIKDIMNGYDDNKIAVGGLGIFFFRLWKIEDDVKKCNSLLRAAKLPVSVLQAIQEKRDSLIRMDAIILAEQTRRAEKRDYLNSLDHIPTEKHYKEGCRCKECKIVKAAGMRLRTANNRERKKREQQRLKRLQEYEQTKRDTTEGLGEQGTDS